MRRPTGATDDISLFCFFAVSIQTIKMIAAPCQKSVAEGMKIKHTGCLTLLRKLSYWTGNFFLFLAACTPAREHPPKIIISSEPQTLYLRDIADSVFYIPLQTKASHLLGDITKIVFTDRHIWVFDEFNTTSIIGFDLNGHLFKRLGQPGQGPGEYLHPTDLAYSPDSNLYLYSNDKFALFRYTDDAQFKEERKWGFFVDKIMPVGRDSFLVYSPAQKTLPDGSDFPYIFFLTVNNKIDQDKKYLLYQNTDFGFFYPGMLFKYKSIVSMSYGFDNYIYAFDGADFFIRYQVDFGNHAPPADLVQYEADKVEQAFIDNQYASLIHRLCETNNWFSFCYYRGRKLVGCFYNKNSGKLLHAGTIVNNLDGGGFRWPVTAYQDFFITYLFPYELRKELAKNRDTNWSNHRHLLNMLDTLNDEDNPILFGYRLRS